MHDEPTRPTEDDLISWSEHDAHTDGARKQPPGPIQPADPTRNGDGPACTSPSPAGLDPVSADAATRPGPGDSHAASVVCFLRAVLAQQIERPAGRMPGSALDELPIAEAAGAVLRFGDLTGLVASVGDLHQRTVRLEQERGRYQLAWCSARTRARGIAGRLRT